MFPTRASSKRGGVGELPGELTDYIFDFIHNDIDSLKTCALVLRAWTPYSQNRLYRTFTCNANIPGKTIEEALVWASSDGARVSQHVTTLVVRSSTTAWLPLPTFRIVDLESLMIHMPNVRRVTIRNLTIHSTNAPPSSIHAAPYIRPLDRLSILSCKTNDCTFHPIGHLLCLFPTIDQLHFVNTICSWDASQESAPWFTFLLSNLRVNELDIHQEDGRADNTGHIALCHILQRAEPPWSLRTLGLSLPRIPQTLPLSGLLNKCTESLVDLWIDVVPTMILPVVANEPISAPVQWRTQFLKDCTQLEILRLNILMISDVSEYYVEVAVALQAVACNDILDANVELVLSAPPQLRSITITFSHFGDLDEETVNAIGQLPAWRRLDDALLRLRHLENVVCIISQDGDLDEETQINLLLLHDLPETPNPSPQLIAPSVSSDDEYARILATGLPSASSAGLVQIIRIS
ncbi:hypothetical protein L226DRAFT_561658 [Lentinus tigrinus ALCF2SS1-7]|uniref:F-box domain-containing protein n=1 Tax=Lentinus tigrinus ALCF2SS1-6 TaxID=1328759 RepID=A0A5C2S4P8_9APHY|nr:hypothetical protein L227DRAFT_654700 [Lentinus tigrinus ALCF2SS1-6]RPD72720.1 hypothetical protein L226DRAFT_561658 [Lentinus tigrinus ALCF2SS1-7]